MSNYSFNSAARAFEERYSISQNAINQEDLQRSILRHNEVKISYYERATEFASAAEIPYGKQPTTPALLVAATQLAIHLCKCRTAPYRVRQERTNSNLYVPHIEWEFHFHALKLLQATWPHMDPIVKRANVLHPATNELLAISSNVYKHDLLPKNQGFEERNALNAEQSQRNLIAQKLKTWYEIQNNKLAVKNWAIKHQVAKKGFMTEWTTVANSQECFLLRADLRYSSLPSVIEKFGAPSHNTVRKNVAEFLDVANKFPEFAGAKWLIAPYVDLSGNWQLPLVALIPKLDSYRFVVQREVQEIWTSVAKIRGKSLESQMCHLQDGEYRFIPNDQAMLDGIDHQLSHAATYLFDTSVIMDTGINTVSSSSGL